MTDEAKTRLMIMKLEQLSKFKETVMPHLENYIHLMNLVGNYQAVVSLDIFLKRNYETQT